VNRSSDVLVVGAGPAGSATALLLARSGFDVVLTDRAAFPRPKPCGDCLSPGASLHLQELGVLPALLRLAPARLRGWRIHSPASHCLEAEFAALAGGDPLLRHGLALPRARLDAALLDAARAAGVRVRIGLRTTALLAAPTGGCGGILATREDGGVERLHARLVVGADGLRSVVARRAGLAGRPPRLRKFSLTAHVRLPDPGPFGEMHLADGLCLGVAPVGDAVHGTVLCNLTLVAAADRFGRAAAAQGAGGFFRATLAAFPRAARLLPDPLPNGWPGRLLASGPFDRPTRGSAAPGLALVGDAAGYYDPFTGQGIHNALAGARRLAAEAAELLRRDRVPLLREYPRHHRRLGCEARLFQRVVEAVLARPAIADAALAVLARRPGFSAALVGVAGDLRPARFLLSATAIRTLACPAPLPEAIS
jgi:menaquinone-9 beta-reductase